MFRSIVCPSSLWFWSLSTAIEPLLWESKSLLRVIWVILQCMWIRIPTIQWLLYGNGIEVENYVAHAHTQNGLAESLIKCLQLIARPLIVRSKLQLMYGDMIFCMHKHSFRLDRVHTISISPSISVWSRHISYLRNFGCAVQKWDHKEDWKYVLVVILHQLYDT